MSNHKMKGLLKGLRYISQMFDDEKEDDIQIGFPTDVKHVAHIGWDGPSVNSPSWMDEFKAAPGFQSQPLGPPAETKNNEAEIQWVSEDSTRRRNQNQNAPVKEAEALAPAPEAPKVSRRHGSTGSSSENPTGEKKEKTKTRRSSKTTKEASESTKTRQPKEPPPIQDGSEPSSKAVPDVPKKSRRKKSRDGAESGSTRTTRTSRRAQATKPSETAPEESESVSRNNEAAPGFNSSEAVEQKGFIEIY